ncbi:DNA sulfur modification protein DndB [Leptolyngbya sp. FACHB-261]|nr:DNA sulfur modification protein DndB [Leptolyngbya sp. FACHB-261]
MQLVIRAVPVQRGPQGEHVSYLSSLPFGDITRLLADGRLYVPNEPELPDLAQRKTNPTRVKSISRYILDTYQKGSTFFPPICVNVQPSPNYSDGNLLLPYDSVVLRLTDGQHRCFGIRKALEDVQFNQPAHFPILSQIEVGVLLYSGLSIEMERQAFRDQNLLAQRPGTSLSYSFDQRSLEVTIAKSLIERVPSFCNNVEMFENGLGRNNAKLLTFSTLVKATQHMFPGLTSDDGLELRTYWATCFWTATARSLLGDPWEIQSSSKRIKQRQQSLLGSAVIFQALGLLAYDLQLEGISAGNLPQWLFRLGEMDWSRENALWQLHGVTTIGSQGVPILQNTKTSIDAAHRILRDFIGLALMNSNLRERTKPELPEGHLADQIVDDHTEDSTITS